MSAVYMTGLRNDTGRIVLRFTHAPYRSIFSVDEQLFGNDWKRLRAFLDKNAVFKCIRISVDVALIELPLHYLDF